MLKLWDHVSITNQDIGKGSDYSIPLSQILIDSVHHNLFSDTIPTFKHDTQCITITKGIIYTRHCCDISALHAARKIFIFTESSSKMKLYGILYNIGNQVTITI